MARNATIFQKWVILGCFALAILVCGCVSEPCGLGQMERATDSELAQIRYTMLERFRAARPFNDISYGPVTYLSDKDEQILSICRVKAETVFWENWQERIRRGYFVADLKSNDLGSGITNTISFVNSFVFRSFVFSRTPIRVAAKTISDQVTLLFPDQEFRVVVDREVGDKEVTIYVRFISIGDALSIICESCDAKWGWEGNIIRIKKLPSNKALEATR